MKTNPFANIELERSDLNVIHDNILEVFYDDKDNTPNLSDEYLIKYFNLLPDTIKYDVMKYGSSDTPTRDNIYVWFKNNIILITTLILK